jgi:hypothetical protein
VRFTDQRGVFITFLPFRDPQREPNRELARTEGFCEDAAHTARVSSRVENDKGLLHITYVEPGGGLRWRSTGTCQFSSETWTPSRSSSLTFDSRSILTRVRRLHSTRPLIQSQTQHHYGLENTAGSRQTASTTSSPGFHVPNLSYTARSSSFIRLDSHGALPFLDRPKRPSCLFIRLPHAVRRQQCRGPPTSTPPGSSQEAAMHLRPWLHGQRDQLPLIPSSRT